VINHNLLQHIMNSGSQSIFWKDRNSVYLGCNRKFARLAGISDPEEIVGKTDFDLPWSRKESEGYRVEDREVMETGLAKQSIREIQQQSGGSVTWVAINKFPLTDDIGQVGGVLGVYEDITQPKLADEKLQKTLQPGQQTSSGAKEGDGAAVYDRELRYTTWSPIERVRAEERCLALQEKLQQMQKTEANGQLAGRIAHDFNNLLTPIFVYAEMIKITLSSNDPNIKKVDALIHAAKKAKELTQKLLSLSR
jgi:PAS domain S-box-containing protein